MTQGEFDEAGGDREGGGIATIIYILYLGGFVSGITPIIGLVMAYIYRDGAPHWLRTHYTYQIRTFWLGLLYVIVGAVTTFIFVGWFILAFWLIWYIVRCVKGLKFAGEGRAIFPAETWWF
ncbi:MAG TPA: hypothetical protein VH020_14160 [Stellaceae bacterium]|jgi:uncharacterized membrane protein|nr:hypothetical protein [Stellaceae bacterium]